MEDQRPASKADMEASMAAMAASITNARAQQMDTLMAFVMARAIKNGNNVNQNRNGRGEKQRRFPPYGDNLRSSKFSNLRRREEPIPETLFTTHYNSNLRSKGCSLSPTAESAEEEEAAESPEPQKE